MVEFGWFRDGSEWLSREIELTAPSIATWAH
jgi:hypothetical protein